MKKRFWQQLLINIINFILYVAFIEAIIRFVTPIPAICITLPVYLIILHTKSPNLLFSLFEPPHIVRTAQKSPYSK